MVEADSGWVAVWFTAPVVETYHRADGAPPSLAALGPDLCRPDVDIETAVERMAALTGPDDEPVLLDQRVAAGIGNVYASEVLFACGVDPFAKVVTMDEATPRTARAGRQAAAGQPRQRTANNGSPHRGASRSTAGTASRASGAARRSRRAARASRRAAPSGARSANPLGRTRARRDAARSEC